MEDLNILKEKLAAIEHERWADWQKYLHSKCLEHTTDFSFVCFPSDLFRRWERQIETKYDNLSEQEKQSDRNEVERYWPLIQEHINKHKLQWLREIAPKEKSEFINVTTMLNCKVVGNWKTDNPFAVGYNNCLKELFANADKSIEKSIGEKVVL